MNSLITHLASAIRRAAGQISLRHYQAKAKQEIYESWDMGAQNVLLVLPTGAGKTRTATAIVEEHSGYACIFAHRQELVTQFALTLNSFGIRFRLIVPKKIRQAIIATVLRKQGICHYDPNAKVAVAGVDTLVRVKPEFAKFLALVTLWICDEAHHTQEREEGKGNTWGRAVRLFTNPACKGLGVTATPKRADGGGMSRDTDGVFDTMVMGPTLQELFNDGYLCPYKIYTVPCNVDYESIDIGASGEFVRAKLVAAEDDGDLVGDIVANYLKYAPGESGVTFVSGVQRAKELADAFNAVGIRAKAVYGDMEPEDRDRAIKDLEDGRLDMLTNDNLFGEGTDLPVVKVVILGTATASLGRYMQWVGRLYRLFLTREQQIGYDALDSDGRRARIAASPKPFGILIDHGRNVIRHDGPPEAPHRIWTLGRYGKRSSKTETLPYRVCANPGMYLAAGGNWTWQQFRDSGWTNIQMIQAGHLKDDGLACAQPYERLHRACPHCGFFPEPVSRSAPDMVEGDLELLDADKLEELYTSMREALLTEQQYRQKLLDTRLTPFKVEAQVKHHRARVCELAHLKWVMGYFGGWWAERGDTDSMTQRRFFHYFGVDVLTAQTLKRADAEVLRERIEKKLRLDGFVIPEYSEA